MEVERVDRMTPLSERKLKSVGGGDRRKRGKEGVNDRVELKVRRYRVNVIVSRVS